MFLQGKRQPKIKARRLQRLKTGNYIGLRSSNFKIEKALRQLNLKVKKKRKDTKKIFRG